MSILPCHATLPKPSNWDCTHRAGKTCPWNFCDYCCVTSGFQMLAMRPCPCPGHRINANPEGYFIPNCSTFLQPYKHLLALPITSPLFGSLKTTAGMAWASFVSGDWRKFQETLKVHAEDRLLMEGITLYVCVWSIVSHKCLESNEVSHVFCW